MNLWVGKKRGSETMRCFKNTLPDLAPGLHVPIDKAHWIKSIEETAQSIVTGMPPTFDNCDGGLYVGCAGVTYMFYYIAQSEPVGKHREHYMITARNYAEVALSYTLSKHNRDPPFAFLLGSAGVYAVAALIYSEMGQQDTAKDLISKYQALASACQPVDVLSYGSDELFVGRAGYLCGALLLNRKFGEVIPKDALHKICASIMHSGTEYAKKHNSPCPLMYAYHGTEYLGAAHGLSAILQMLLAFPEFLASDPIIEEKIRGSVDFILSIQQPTGNVVPATDELKGGRSPDHELVHWCHGGPGVVYLFAKAYRVWKDDKYLNACLKCGELAWRKGLLKKGPGICHGVAGSAYVFLLLYRMTSDEKYLHRAIKFAEFMQSGQFAEGARRPDSPFSLYEGLAGTVCFLTDMLQPQRAEFPFFDVLG